MKSFAFLKGVAFLFVVILLWQSRSQSQKMATRPDKDSDEPEIAKLKGQVVEVRNQKGKILLKIEDDRGHFFWAITSERAVHPGDQVIFEMTVAQHHYFARDFGLSLPECYLVSQIDVRPLEA